MIGSCEKRKHNKLKPIKIEEEFPQEECCDFYRRG